MITLRTIWEDFDGNKDNEVAVCMTHDDKANVIRVAVCGKQKSRSKESSVLVLRAETLKTDDFKRYDLQLPISQDSLVKLNQGLWQEWQWSMPSEGGRPEGF